MLKRSFDIVTCLLAAPVTVPVCVIIGLVYFALERESPLFFQKRVGRDEKEFAILKLRTMRKTTVEQGTHRVDKTAVTRTGRFLRSTKLDELPQLWNVLVGHMSLVGPRPCLLSQKQLINDRRELGVFSVRPGITGQSQIDGIDMSNSKILAYSDARYIAQASFLGDLRLLIQTFLGQGSGDNVKY